MWFPKISFGFFYTGLWFFLFSLILGGCTFDYAGLSGKNYCETSADCLSGYFCCSHVCSIECNEPRDVTDTLNHDDLDTSQDSNIDSSEDPEDTGDTQQDTLGDTREETRPDTSDGSDNDIDEEVPCEDTDLCTSDEVIDGQCQHIPMCQPDSNPCTRNLCDPLTGACQEEVLDGASCDDGNLCNGSELCVDSVCMRGPAVECEECRGCFPETGECACDGSCSTELCNGQDDDCDGEIDEGACTGEPGIQVEVSWEDNGADIDLHFLRRGGTYGTSDNFDENDCCWNNPQPDWGEQWVEGDDPFYLTDYQRGSGEGISPETVTLEEPADGIYRVLVYHPRFNIPNTRVWVKIYYAGQLMESLTQVLPRTRDAWNVGCLDYTSRTVNLLLNSEGEPQIDNIDALDPNACQTGGVDCEHICDCSEGYDCIDGVCTEAENIFCCDWDPCPNGARCRSLETEREIEYCDVKISFDWGYQGDRLVAGTDVEHFYAPIGVLFDTDRENSTVSVDEYSLDSESGGNSCATLDDNGTRWLGAVNMTLIEPSPANQPSTRKLSSNLVRFHVGEIGFLGLYVSAYNEDDKVVVEYSVSWSGQMVVEPGEPFHSIWIEPVDEDFVIDDVYVERPFRLESR